jgi:hypothetical protein
VTPTAYSSSSTPPDEDGDGNQVGIILRKYDRMGLPASWSRNPGVEEAEK